MKKLVIKIDTNNLFVGDEIINDFEEIPIDCIDPDKFPVPEGLHLPHFNGSGWDEGKVFSIDEVKAKKRDEIIKSYATELNSTFFSSATGTSLEYDFSDHSETLWKDLRDSIRGGDIPDTAFPMNITLANGTTVLHDKVQILQIIGELAMRNFSMYQKLQGMVVVNGSIDLATTTEEVNTISW